MVASSYPRFTLLLQSLGSIIVAHEALSRLTPDIFIDTMGYSFSTWYCKYLFPHIAIGSYVHYPFIGTHMVESLTSDSGQGVNAGMGKGWRGFAKKLYWHSLLRLYTWTGPAIDAVMTNSSWTQNHMQRIWGESRKGQKKSAAMVLYPPCSVEEIIDKIPLEGNHATPREKLLLCIAQFRPEKNHELLIRAFQLMLHTKAPEVEGARLVLVGSVRDSEDETLVYKLRLLANELKVDKQVDFRINSTWGEILDWLKTSWIGVNGMWCEHFGIGVVEYQAAGLIPVVNDSGGPKEDIVVDYEGEPTGTLTLLEIPSFPAHTTIFSIGTQFEVSLTLNSSFPQGFHASTPAEYADYFTKALSLSLFDTLAMRKRNRLSSQRFTTETFTTSWCQQLSRLIDISK